MGFLVLKLPFFDYCTQIELFLFCGASLVWREVSGGGGEDHPTIPHSGQIFRHLSRYMSMKGNCSGDADLVLVTLEPSLSTTKLEALSRKEDHQNKLATILD